MAGTIITQEQVITHEELDDRLEVLAQDPESFTAECELLAREWNEKGVALEVSDPMTWRKPASPSSRVSMRQQFRTEIDSIVSMDRQEEARLARRIEFARIRLDDALKSAGLSNADLVEGIHSGSSGFVGSFTADCELAPQVCRRWLELHALRTEMVERNLYLVLINVERYSHTTASQVDLIQEGSASLFRAVDGFDWRRGLLFRTYAVHWLNQAFRSYLYNFTNTVRVPVYLQKAMKHVNDARNRLGNAKASVAEIAAEADLGENLVASAMAAARSSRSLDKSFDDDEEGGRLRDVLQEADDDGPYSTDLEDVTLEDSLSEALDRLSERERYVVEMRFGINVERAHTLSEVAKELGVSLERVRQIQVRAINKLRNPTLRRAIDPFLN